MKVNIDRILEIAAKIINIIRPTFFNKLTWTVVIAGLGLMSSPFWEKVLSAILKSRLNIEITGDNDVVWGFGLVFSGLCYHVATTSIFDAGTKLESRRKSEANLLHDTDLLNSLLELLPSTGIMLFIKDFDFGNSFPLNRIDSAYKFVCEWENAEYEFQNTEIEMAKKVLWKTCFDFTQKVNRNTAPNHSGWQSVIPRGVDPEFGLSQQILDEIKEINEAATEFYKSHQELIRIAKKILGNY